MSFKKWVKSIQTAGYNGARSVPKCMLSIALLAQELQQFLNRDSSPQNLYIMTLHLPQSSRFIDSDEGVSKCERVNNCIISSSMTYEKANNFW